jgi:hypothetical protein
MAQTVTSLFTANKDAFKVPYSIQGTVPIKKIYEDGIFELSSNRYSKSFSFRDINYSGLSTKQQEDLHNQWQNVLNSFKPEATTKITINNRVLNRVEFEKEMCLALTGDEFDDYRKEYNAYILSKATEGDNKVREYYVTITIRKDSYEEAKEWFLHMEIELQGHFSRLGSPLLPINGMDRLRIIHDFFQPDKLSDFYYEIKNARKLGVCFKDYILPESMEFEPKGRYMLIGDKYARVLFVKNFGTFVPDDVVTSILALNKSMMFSMDNIAVPQDMAVNISEGRLLAVETNGKKWRDTESRRGSIAIDLPYDMEKSIEDMRDFLNDLYARDKRMFFTSFTIIHLADSLKELDEDTEKIMATASAKRCELGVLRWQQLDGLISCLPYGVYRLDNIARTMTTESLATCMPFNAKDVRHVGGMYFGQNVKSKNVIVINREKLANGNSFVVGVSGSGKSFSVKKEITNIKLADPNADIIIIDPENEYRPLVDAMHGEVIEISSVSPNHINPMDMNVNYGDGENPINLKTELILSIYEHIVNNEVVTAQERTIISRCVELTYFRAKNSGKDPTLNDLYQMIVEQPDEKAQYIATNLELFAKGRLDTFSHESNINMDNQIICFDILRLSTQLRSVGMLIILDAVWNRITDNKSKGKNTYLIIDEIYLLFAHEYSANFLETLWRRIRKYGGYCIGITQNVAPLLDSPVASTMFANSEYLVMLRQSGNDPERLRELFNLSDEEIKVLTSGDSGTGILKLGNDFVQFDGTFPKNTKLYNLYTTKPSDRQDQIKN